MIDISTLLTSLGYPEKLSINQCERVAKDLAVDNPGKVIAFDLCGPKGKFRCKWLDPYLGLFEKAEESKGFFSVRDFEFHSELWCENLELKDESTKSDV